MVDMDSFRHGFKFAPGNFEHLRRIGGLEGLGGRVVTANRSTSPHVYGYHKKDPSFGQSGQVTLLPHHSVWQKGA